jgi:ABC-type Mn2+/Zn2+ transport system ATPase subunit
MSAKIIIVIGPVGAGKTSLVKLLMGPGCPDKTSAG